MINNDRLWKPLCDGYSLCDVRHQLRCAEIMPACGGTRKDDSIPRLGLEALMRNMNEEDKGATEVARDRQTDAELEH